MTDKTNQPTPEKCLACPNRSRRDFLRWLTAPLTQTTEPANCTGPVDIRQVFVHEDPADAPNWPKTSPAHVLIGEFGDNYDPAATEVKPGKNQDVRLACITTIGSVACGQDFSAEPLQEGQVVFKANTVPDQTLYIFASGQETSLLTDYLRTLVSGGYAPADVLAQLPSSAENSTTAANAPQ